ncbi:ROK family transcriptional regulator [Streptosporangium sandarakinum]|uniref:Putative NBD/HSP70 family sugar kinase n=1 Tax=Streptosporangium sandarakinum TaxID=1260955 RepID=A0A852V6F1_9ACTN|nr:ROK family transcriptional regulator [Streptosporangium sandarakinum]NYF43716.1 putative NBD/HSP70 family sugar kinase [Streptosporangium sandarakinum]
MSRQPQAAALPSGASTVLRNLNERSVVVQLLHDTPLTRVDLAERTGLALPTISRAVANLERSGIVRATGRDTSRKGPAAALYEVRPVGGGLAAAVSVTSVGLAVSLLGLRGERVALAEAPAERVPGGAPLHLQVRGLLERALAHAGASRPEVWHGVVSVPTVVDAGGVLHRDLPSALPAFDQVSIDAIVELFGGAATVENDVNLSALGERAAGVARDVDDFVYVSVGRGLGMGVVMHGEIHRGATGAAGEISRMPLGHRSLDDPGIRDSGRLHHSVTEQALAEYATAEGLPETGPDAVFGAAARGDERAVRAVRQVARHLAGAVAVTAAVLDPALVVLGGTVGGRHALLDPVRAELARLVKTATPVMSSALGADAALRGAEAVASGRVRDELLRRVSPAGAAER